MEQPEEDVLIHQDEPGSKSRIALTLTIRIGGLLAMIAGVLLIIL
jgi:hypothetical protein